MSYIGLDIGGTNVRYAYTDEFNSKVLNCQKRPFIKADQPHTEVEENICSIIDMTPGDRGNRYFACCRYGSQYRKSENMAQQSILESL